MTALFLKEVARNPWTAGLFLLPPLLALGFQGRGEGVGLVGLYSGLSLLLPPLVLALAVPLLASREEWAFLLGFPVRPFLAFLQGVLGVLLGLAPPLLLGLLLGAGLLGFSWEAGLWLLLSGMGLLLFWLGLAALLSALLLEERRALALGFGLFGLLNVLYGPLVVALAVRLRDYPLEGLLTLALLLNPQEVHRVGLLLGLKAPVLTGPVGYLVAERLGTVGPLLGLGYLVLFGLLLTLLAATLFARRDR
ncbi:MAG: hypothetical protein RQ998_09360 [Thermus sp.]|nr:hypothetical protein [Thermus sp.]